MRKFRLFKNKFSPSSAHLLYAFVFLIAFIFTECKKGEDDPKISLRTRKARICGSWNLKSGQSRLRVNQKGVSPVDQAFQSMDGSTTTVYDDYTMTYSKIQYSVHLEIKKDGTFTLNENISGSILDASGTWDFAGGGKNKNKSEVFFKIDQVSIGSTGNHLFNKECTEFTYEITQLRNDKLSVDISNDIYINSNGDQIQFSGHFYFHS